MTRINKGNDVESNQLREIKVNSALFNSFHDMRDVFFIRALVAVVEVADFKRIYFALSASFLRAE